MPISAVRFSPSTSRLRITRLAGATRVDTLAADVVAGFEKCPRSLPPKYFYDARGARLFDAICDTPEYYPTRTEQALLDATAGDIAALARPTHLVELGSGAARKTRTLIDAARRGARPLTYVPVNISEQMLVASSRRLLGDYPDLRVHAVVADYDHHLHLLPREGRRLIAFLGLTIGNFTQPAAVRFLSAIRRGMAADDRLLIGFDLVKSPAVLHAAYNDAAGLTTEFNRNVLYVLNRRLGGTFDPDSFDHIGEWHPEQRQMEMYLESRVDQTVTLEVLGRSYSFAAGERIHTEISRKHDRSMCEEMMAGAGLSTVSWFQSPDDYFALMLAAPIA